MHSFTPWLSCSLSLKSSHRTLWPFSDLCKKANKPHSFYLKGPQNTSPEELTSHHKHHLITAYKYLSLFYYYFLDLI